MYVYEVKVKRGDSGNIYDVYFIPARNLGELIVKLSKKKDMQNSLLNLRVTEISELCKLDK